MWLKEKALRPGLQGQRRAKFWEDHLLRTERGSLQETMGMLSPFPKMGNNMRVQNNPDEEKRVLSELLGRLGGSVRRKVGLGWHSAS